MMHIIGRREVALLLAGVFALEGAPSWAQQPAAKVPSQRQIIGEALADARTNVRHADRLQVTLAVLPALQRIDPAEARVVAEEAVAVAKKLPQGTVGVRTVIADVLAVSLFLGFGAYVAWASHREETRNALTLEGTLGLKLVELLILGDRALALDAAATIQEPYARARALALVFRASAPSDGISMQAAREQAARAVNQASAVSLAGLANGVAPADKRLALELIHLALERLRSTASESRPEEVSYVYQVLAALDPSGADEELGRILGANKDKEDALLVFAKGMLPDRPSLAWRAIKADVDRSETHVMELAYVLRQIAGRLSPDTNREVREHLLELLPKPQKYKFFYTSGMGRGDVIATADLLATLAAIDYDLAWQHADASSFDRKIAGDLLLSFGFRNREFLDRFPTDLVRLELALSLLETRPVEALAVLESFSEQFWTAIGKAAWSRDRTPGQSYSIFEWLSERLELVRTEWVAAARRLADVDSAAARRTLHRFQEVAGWVDAMAVERLGMRAKHRGLWISHLPFFLASAAEAIADIDPNAADEAIHRSVKLASTLSSPAREWALCWNAVAWKRIDTPVARATVLDALGRAQRLKGHGGPDWRSGAPQFAHQVARLDPMTAYAFAQKEHSPVYAATLAAVVSGMTIDTSVIGSPR